MVVEVKGHQLLKREYKDSPMTLPALTSFLDSCDSASLPLFWKSELPARFPDRPSSSGLEVTGVRFRELVKKPGQSVVVWVYAPGCTGCSEVGFGEVAAVFRNQPEVAFLKVNGAKNELEEFHSNKFPALIAFPASTKRPFVFSGKYEKEEMISFIKSVLMSDPQPGRTKR